MKKKLAIVITLSKSHIHYCKALIASIEYFNPELEIIIIKDGDFNIEFLKDRKQVHVVDSREVNKLHGLDLYILLNKLNILFLPELGFDFETFLHIDADSIVTNTINNDELEGNDFIILQGNKINRDDEKSMNNLARYAFNPADFNEYVFNPEQLYYFSASHIAINKRIIPKLIEYLKIHRYELNKEFLNDKRIRFNDQGFLNLMVNYLSHIGEMKVKINDAGIYGKQSEKDFPKLTLQNVKNKVDTEVLFIHYTASSRKVTLRAHNFGEILDYFSKQFYGNNIVHNYEEFFRVVKHHKNKFLKKFRNKIKHLKNKI